MRGRGIGTQKRVYHDCRWRTPEGPVDSPHRKCSSMAAQECVRIRQSVSYMYIPVFNQDWRGSNSKSTVSGIGIWLLIMLTWKSTKSEEQYVEFHSFPWITMNNGRGTRESISRVTSSTGISRPSNNWPLWILRTSYMMRGESEKVAAGNPRIIFWYLPAAELFSSLTLGALHISSRKLYFTPVVSLRLLLSCPFHLICFFLLSL